MRGVAVRRVIMTEPCDQVHNIREVDLLRMEVRRLSSIISTIKSSLEQHPSLMSAELKSEKCGFKNPSQDAAGTELRMRSNDMHRIQSISATDIRKIVRMRRMREQFFPSEFFADPAWDMMLDLFAARLEKRLVSVSSLCIASAVPATTALRWIKSMTGEGILERRSDPLDGRRVHNSLSDEAVSNLYRYFADMRNVCALLPI